MVNQYDTEELQFIITLSASSGYYFGFVQHRFAAKNFYKAAQSLYSMLFLSGQYLIHFPKCNISDDKRTCILIEGEYTFPIN